MDPFYCYQDTTPVGAKIVTTQPRRSRSLFSRSLGDLGSFDGCPDIVAAKGGHLNLTAERWANLWHIYCGVDVL